MDDIKYTDINSLENIMKETKCAPHDLKVVISSENEIIQSDNDINTSSVTINDKTIIQHKNKNEVVCEEIYSLNDTNNYILEERKFYNDEGSIIYYEVFCYKNKSNPSSHEKCNSMIKDTKGNIIGFRFYKREQDGKSKINEKEYCTLFIGYDKNNKTLNTKFFPNDNGNIDNDNVSLKECNAIMNHFISNMVKTLKPHEIGGFESLLSAYILSLSEKDEENKENITIVNEFCFQDNIENLLEIPSENNYITKEIIDKYLKENEIDTKKTILIPIGYNKHASLLVYKDNKLYAIDSSGYHFNSIYNENYVNRVFKSDNLQQWGLCSYFTMMATKCMFKKNYDLNSPDNQFDNQLNLIIDIVVEVGKLFGIDDTKKFIDAVVDGDPECYEKNLETLLKQLAINNFFNIKNFISMLEEFNGIEKSNELSIYNEECPEKYKEIKKHYLPLIATYYEHIETVDNIVNNNEEILLKIKNIDKKIKFYDNLIQEKTELSEIERLKKARQNLIEAKKYAKKNIDTTTVQENNELTSYVDNYCTHFLNKVFYCETDELNEKNLNKKKDLFDEFLINQEAIICTLELCIKKDYKIRLIEQQHFKKPETSIFKSDINSIDITEIDIVENEIKIDIEIEENQKFRWNNLDKIEFKIKLKDNLSKNINIINQDLIYKLVENQLSKQKIINEIKTPTKDSVYIQNIYGNTKNDFKEIVSSAILEVKDEKNIDYKNFVTNLLNNNFGEQIKKELYEPNILKICRKNEDFCLAYINELLKKKYIKIEKKDDKFLIKKEGIEISINKDNKYLINCLEEYKIDANSQNTSQQQIILNSIKKVLEHKYINKTKV